MMKLVGYQVLTLMIVLHTSGSHQQPKKLDDPKKFIHSMCTSCHGCPFMTLYSCIFIFYLQKNLIDNLMVGKAKRMHFG